MSVHVERRHKGLNNPLKLFKNPDYAIRTLQKINPIPIFPDFDSNGPFQPSIELQDILQRISRLSRFELMILLPTINQRLSQ